MAVIVEANCFGPIDYNPPVELPIREYVLEKEYLLMSNRKLLVTNTKSTFCLDKTGVFDHLYIPTSLSKKEP
ncbi:hypothetical protein EZV61_09100 [Corallincola luteus]|uniref:Uncharacterized protein n=2 Tax=Corallincola TaxID=1775176 RepID=A0A368NJD4_9GAMM|nr:MULTISPECIES: hypothetical protein [Corallincola]RCU49993.1 hypothetical protein DU002_10225 [Corallincola holothuriorum]TCI03691.1 hypothetical protein EZV61_09100 [Corallincola luteus]